MQTPPETPSTIRKRPFSEGLDRLRNVRQRINRILPPRPLARAAGATLGYITGNLPGAYIGYNLADMAWQRRAARRRNFSRRRVTRGYKKYGKKSPAAVGVQRDVVTQYRRKPMPRYKKKTWKKFTKKVNAVVAKSQGLKTVVFNDKIDVSSTAGNQQLATLALYGNNGSADDSQNLGWRDLYRVYKNEPSISKDVGGEPIQGKLHFQSAAIDITLKNNSPDLEMECDIYYGYFRKDTVSATKTNLGSQFFAGCYNVDKITAGNAQIDITQRGVTPFDCSGGLSRTAFHIVKKQKMDIQPGKSFFLQHRISSNKVMDWLTIKNYDYAIKGLTFGMMIVFKPTVSTSTTATAQFLAGVTRKYSYINLEENQDFSSYDHA